MYALFLCFWSLVANATSPGAKQNLAKQQEELKQQCEDKVSSSDDDSNDGNDSNDSNDGNDGNNIDINDNDDNDNDNDSDNDGNDNEDAWGDDELGQDGEENNAVVTALASINIGRSRDNNPWVVEDPMGLVTEEELKEHDLPPVCFLHIT